MEHNSALFELSLALQAKAFPYDVVATAIYVNYNCKRKGKEVPIVITPHPVPLLDPKDSASTAKLVRKKE